MTALFALLIVIGLVAGLLQWNTKVDAKRRRQINRARYERERSQPFGEFDR